METKIKKIKAKVSDYINQNKKRRVLIGMTLSLGSMCYQFFMIDITGNGQITAVFMHMLNSLLFLIGLVIITGSKEIVSKIFNKLAIEAVGICILVIALKLIYDFLAFPFIQLKLYQSILLLMSTLVVMFYLVRLLIFIYMLLKKAYNLMIEVMKNDGVKNGTELLNKILQNLVSIAGALGLIYGFIKPIIALLVK